MGTIAVYFRSDTAEIHVTITGISLDKESWDMMEGGDPVAEEVVIFPGGQEPQVALGGLAKWSAITVERAWCESLALVYKQIAGGVGTLPMTVSYIQRNAGAPRTDLVDTYTGVLSSAERPKYKASESTDAYLKITSSINGGIS